MIGRIREFLGTRARTRTSLGSYQSLLLYRSGTRLYGEHPLHTFIWETVQKEFFAIDYEGVIVISIRVLRREVARQQLPNPTIMDMITR